MATSEEILIANKTSRNSKAIGHNALTPKAVRRYVEKHLNKSTAVILDFGAGKTAPHTAVLREDGFLCLAHEFGGNVDVRYHCELAMLNKYEVVFASNVLNVQSSLTMLHETLAQVKSVMKPDGVFIANFPLSPRKMDMHTKQMWEHLKKEFSNVTITMGSNQAPVFLMEI